MVFAPSLLTKDSEVAKSKAPAPPATDPAQAQALMMAQMSMNVDQYAVFVEALIDHLQPPKSDEGWSGWLSNILCFRRWK